MDYYAAQDAFRSALMSELGNAPSVLEEGRLQRFDDPDKRKGNKNCWCVFYYHQPWAAGCFGNWALDFKQNWSLGNEQRFTAEERAAFERKRREAQNLLQLTEQEKHQQAAAQAQCIWDQSQPADPRHPYLLKKGVPPGMARQNQMGQLVLQVKDLEQQSLISLQFIQADGSKRYLKGGRKKGGCMPVHCPENPLLVLICEGWATGQTLAMAYPKALVLAGLDAGNLLAVARQIQQLYPHLLRVICGDDDRLSPGNPGRSKAQQAALQTGAEVLLPDWPETAPPDLKDFNDLAVWLQHANATRSGA